MRNILSYRIVQCAGDAVNTVPYTPLRPIYIHKILVRLSGAVADTNPLFLVFDGQVINKVSRDFTGPTTALMRIPISSTGSAPTIVPFLQMDLNYMCNSFSLVPNGVQKFDLTVFYNFVDELPDYYIPASNAFN